MDSFLSHLSAKYGWRLLVAGSVLVTIVWAITHFASDPGEKVSVLWGMVEYTKGKTTLNRNASSSSSEKNNSLDSPKEKVLNGEIDPITYEEFWRQHVALQGRFLEQEEFTSKINGKIVNWLVKVFHVGAVGESMLSLAFVPVSKELSSVIWPGFNTAYFDNKLRDKLFSLREGDIVRITGLFQTGNTPYGHVEGTDVELVTPAEASGSE